ncbi:MAG TPA: thiamine pyrophosphate-binding protein, partial [Methylomirabilota bacterium]|nr:thiamine pyrophosphate-binding protein [Methylomirabilota bacterium]
MSRTTVAAVLADGLRRAGARRLFAAAGGRAHPLAAAAAARGLPVAAAGSDLTACLMAAAAAELNEAPGAALLGLDGGARGAVEGLAHAARDRTPVIALGERHPDAGLVAPVVKATLAVDAASA